MNYEDFACVDCASRESCTANERCLQDKAPASEPDVVNVPLADLARMLEWANGVMTREPDFIIGDDYLRRWWVVPRNHFANVYLHEILRSDDDRALHDHPWDNVSVVLDGTYREYTPDGSFDRAAGDVVSRKATDSHRLEIPEGGRAVSLFMTGPKLREWGFHCPQGWRIWTEFVDMRDSGKVGRGCE